MKYIIIVFIILFYSCKTEKGKILGTIEEYSIYYNDEYGMQSILLNAKLQLFNNTNDTIIYYLPYSCSEMFPNCNYSFLLSSDTFLLENNNNFNHKEVIFPFDSHYFYIDLLKFDHCKFSLYDIHKKYHQDFLDAKILYKDSEKTILFNPDVEIHVDYSYNGEIINENDSLMQRKLLIPPPPASADL